MAKGEDKEKKEAARTAASESLDRQKIFQQEQEQKRKEYETQSNSERQALLGSIQPNLGTTGGLDPTVINNIRGLYTKPGTTTDSSSSGSGGGGGGSSTPATPQPGVFDESERAFRDINTESQANIGRLRTQVDELTAMAKTGAMDPAAAASVQAIADKLKNFQFDPNAAAEIRGQIDQLSQYGRTGGVDPERLAGLRSTIDSMMGGGISEPDLARWRGTGYEEFAKTGGWSDAERMDYRDRATSTIPALYQQQMADAARLQNVGGGNAGGFLAAAGRLNRQSSQDMVKAARDAEIDLGSQIRKERQWGIEGLAKTEEAIQKQQGLNKATGLASGVQLENDIASNKITAADMSGKLNVSFNEAVNNAFIQAQSGAGTLESNMAQAIAQNRVKAQEAAATAEGVAQKLRTEAQQASAQGLLAVAAQKQAAADRAAAVGQAASAASAAQDRWEKSFQAQNERWIGESQMQGQQRAQQLGIQLYGMDPTLDRDRFGLDIENSITRNAGINSEMASGGKGVDWAKWAGMGIGGANAYNNYRDGSTGGNGGGSGGYTYDSDDPNSIWYDPQYDSDDPNSFWYDGGSGGGSAPGPNQSKDDWWYWNSH